MSDVDNSGDIVKVGLVVEPKDPFRKLIQDSKYKFSSHKNYSYAIVVSMVPFVLVSDDAGARWETTVVADDFKVIGRARPSVVERAMTRLVA